MAKRRKSESKKEKRGRKEAEEDKNKGKMSNEGNKLGFSWSKLITS